MTQQTASDQVGSRVVFEDDRVRVWELEVGPGETFPLHHHALDYITVSLDEAELEAHEADGSVRRNHRLPGDVLLTRVGGGQNHELRNVGTTAYRNRIVEFKAPPAETGGKPSSVELPGPRPDR